MNRSVIGWLLVLWVGSGVALAETYVARSCALAHVREAVDIAREGDIVQVPGGSCWWRDTLKIPEDKGITLVGGESGPTTIHDATSKGEPLIQVQTVESKAYRITGFTFTGATGWEGLIDLKGTTKRLRIDHCRFVFTLNRDNRGIYVRDGVEGVVDHCVFEGAGEAVNAIFVYGKDFESWTEWYQPGTRKAFYVEDCVFDFNLTHEGAAAVDGSRGAKVVFRHNQLRNTNVVGHGLDSGHSRSLQLLEIYDNVFSTDFPMARAIHLRGGTAVIFNNRFFGPWGTMLGLSSYRSCCSEDTLCSDWGRFDGQPEMLCAGDFATSCHTDADCPSKSCSVLFCSVSADWLCQVDSDCPSGETCTRYVDGQEDASGYPGRDQVGRSTNQKRKPVYEWDNQINPTMGQRIAITPSNCPNPSPEVHIKRGRDYFENTLRPNYRPFTYPHPMTVER